MTFPFASRPGRELMGGSLTNVEGGGGRCLRPYRLAASADGGGVASLCNEVFLRFGETSKCVSSY